MSDFLSGIDTLHLLLILLVVFLGFALFIGRGRKSGDKPAKRKGVSLSGIIFVFILVLLMLVFGGYLVLGQMYNHFTSEKLIATVSFSQTISDSTDFIMTITFNDGPEKGKTQTLPIRGEQWAIGGHVLKWNPFLTVFGMQSLYKLTRIEGRYQDLPAGRQPSVYILASERESGLWRFFYRNAHRIPLVSSVYGNMIYTFPSFNREFNIYVTPTGFFPRLANRSTMVAPEQELDRPMR